MNAKGETLQLSPAWEALPLGMQFGVSLRGNPGNRPKNCPAFRLGGRPSSQRCHGVSCGTLAWCVVALPPSQRLRTGPKGPRGGGANPAPIGG